MATSLDSVCPLDCPDTCSLSVTRRRRPRSTRVDGSHRNPLTDGFICAKVRRYPERVYSPLRVLYPQRRVGAKGEGRFERISWDDAHRPDRRALPRASSPRDGAEAILPYHYGGSNGVFGEGAADARFFHRLGASRAAQDHLRARRPAPCTAPCTAPWAACRRRTTRWRAAIMLWGVNPSATSIHLVPHVRAAQARRRVRRRDRSAPHAAGAHRRPAPRAAPGHRRRAGAGDDRRAASGAARPTATFVARTPTASTSSRAAAAEWPLAARRRRVRRAGRRHRARWSRPTPPRRPR